MKNWLIGVSIALALAGGVAHAAGDAAAGKQKAVACGACHGMDGNSVAPQFPNLAGQHGSYIEKQIADFKAGIRKDPVMSAQAAAIKDADLPDIAAYFSAQSVKGGAADPAKVALGQKVFRAGDKEMGIPACNGCHGPAGMGNPLAKFPRISGQKAQYVTKALKDFRSGARTGDPNAMMRGVAAHMSDEEIDAVAQYLQGLHP